VLLRDGSTVLTGRVETEGDLIYVAGRAVRQSDTALDDDVSAAEEAPGAAHPGSETSYAAHVAATGTAVRLARGTAPASTMGDVSAPTG